MTRRLDVFAVLIVVTGVVALIGGLNGALRESDAAFALPFVASGVMGGLALIVFGLGLLRLQSTRRAALAAHHERVADLTGEGVS